MTTITRVPTGDVFEGVEFIPKGAGTNFSEVDEGVSAEDDNATENVADGNNTEDLLTFANMPGDFDTAIDYTISIVSKQAGRVDDTLGIATELEDIDTDDIHNLDATTTYTEFNGTTWSSSVNAATFNAYVQKIRSSRGASGMPDAIEIFYTAVEVVINYNATGGAPARRIFITSS